MKWSGFVWPSCQGFGWLTERSSHSWRAPPGLQTVAGGVCYGAGRCCWRRVSSSIWCPGVSPLVCLFSSAFQYLINLILNSFSVLQVGLGQMPSHSQMWIWRCSDLALQPVPEESPSHLLVPHEDPTPLSGPCWVTKPPNAVWKRNLSQHGTGRQSPYTRGLYSGLGISHRHHSGFTSWWKLAKVRGRRPGTGMAPL